MMHKNFMHRHLRRFPVQHACMEFYAIIYPRCRFVKNCLRLPRDAKAKTPRMPMHPGRRVIYSVSFFA